MSSYWIMSFSSTNSLVLECNSYVEQYLWHSRLQQYYYARSVTYHFLKQCAAAVYSWFWFWWWGCNWNICEEFLRWDWWDIENWWKHNFYVIIIKTLINYYWARLVWRDFTSSSNFSNLESATYLWTLNENKQCHKTVVRAAAKNITFH